MTEVKSCFIYCFLTILKLKSKKSFKNCNKNVIALKWFILKEEKNSNFFCNKKCSEIGYSLPKARLQPVHCLVWFFFFFV